MLYENLRNRERRKFTFISPHDINMLTTCSVPNMAKKIKDYMMKYNRRNVLLLVPYNIG